MLPPLASQYGHDSTRFGHGCTPYRRKTRMAFKITYLARRNPKIAAEDFSEAWRSHSRLAGTLVNTLGKHFLRVRQCIKVYDAKVPPEYVNPHDGTALLTMKSWDDLLK